jgi:hypothetical protein
MAGAVAAAATSPLDVVKTRLQVFKYIHFSHNTPVRFYTWGEKWVSYV